MSFSNLPVGSRVVLHETGAYCNESWYFGIVVQGPRGAPRCQLVGKTREVMDDTGITRHDRVRPQWDQPLPSQVYAVATGRAQHNAGMQYLKSFRQRCSKSGMNYVPIYEGIYAEGRAYVDCTDSP